MTFVAADARYQLPRGELLTSWMKAFNFARKVSACHARLWNQYLSASPSPRNEGRSRHLIAWLVSLAYNPLYAVAARLRFILQTIIPERTGRNAKEMAASFPAGVLPIQPDRRLDGAIGWR
ncbi:Abi family protein [Teichococcus aestuarii]|uniref:hypothetical protein n=1 Tax=Teichococcus aestuarii TaxID=568898 RepID=UPI0011B24AE0|nr:hypothetical protein [Pseudoroseomonas aestuarii]